MLAMHYKKLPKENLMTFIKGLEGWGEVHVPKKNGSSTYLFGKLNSPGEVCLSYNRTILPPTKKYFVKPKEKLMIFDKNGVKEISEDKKIVLFGVHACDINALKILDKAYLGVYRDSYYERRRKNTIIIGISCMPDEYCFCKSVNADYVTSGFDLFLHEIEDGYLLRIGTHKGQEIVWKLSSLLKDVTPEDIEALKAFEEKRSKAFKRKIEIAGMPDILDLAYESSVWKKYSEKCLGCGSCTLVCPTCRCFEVCDNWIDAYRAVRIRRYDSCFMYSHGLVAGGHNFRPTRLDRFRHRYYCKSYLDPTHGLNCVGCGRCDEFCPAKIRHVEVIEEVMGEIYGEKSNQ